MKKAKFYKRILVLLAAGTFSLQTIGCSSDTTKEVIIENNDETNKKTDTETSSESNDKSVLEKVDEWMSDTNNIINYEKMDNINSFIQEKLITMTDFVVFGGTITLDNGEEVTLKDCSKEVINKVESIYSLMIAKIEEKYPGTTSKIGDYFNSAKNFTKEKSKDAKEYLGDKIDEYIDSGYKNGYYDESTYDFMKKFKEGIGPQLKEDFNNGKETIKDLYNKGKDAWNDYLDEREAVKTK